MTKKDNPKSEKITVVPLTSKKGVHNIPLGFNISKEIALYLAETGIRIASKKDNPLDVALTFLTISYEKQNLTDSPTEKYFLEKLQREKELRENIKRQMNYYMKDLDILSYIKVDNVSTISKFRIRKSKHEYDPLGKMILNDSYMNMVDKAIVSFLLDN